MKATVKLILFLITFSFVACDKDEDDFSKKDSYLYVWNVRTWEVGKESKLSDIKVTYFFKGDTTRVQNINFWINQREKYALCRRRDGAHRQGFSDKPSPERSRPERI